LQDRLDHPVTNARESEPRHAPSVQAWALVGLVVVVAVLYFATARVGLLLALPPAYKATAIWPPSGIALAAVLLFGVRAWPGIWLGAFCANVVDHFWGTEARFDLVDHVMVAIVIACGSTLQAIIGAFITRKVIGPVSPLDRGWDVLRFFGIALVMCIVAASISVPMLIVARMADSSSFATNWLTWWLGDTAGVLLVTPFLLVWMKRGVRLPPARILEALVAVTLLVIVALIGFGAPGASPAFATAAAHLTIPLIVLAAFSFGQHGATACVLLLSVIAVWCTANGLGPFHFDSIQASLLSVQAFVVTVSLTALALAAVLSERRRTERAKSLAIERLEQAMAQISTLEGAIPICAWCRKVRNDGGSWEMLEDYIRRHSEASFSHGICPDCFETASPRTTGSKNVV
jgi:integral membrane sensor domain MASE1